MNNKQKGFLLYLDNYDLIEDLSFEEMGRWINAIFHYKRDKEIPNFKKGSLLNTAFKVAKNQLDRDAEAWEEKCQKRADAGRKGGQAKASNAKQKQAKASNAKQEVANLADNDTDNDNDSVSVTDTDTDTVIETDTEQTNADSGSADLLTSSAAAENAEPSAGDLFSLAQIKKKAKSGKVDLSEEGIKAFYEQMQDDSWMLYGKPVEKRYLLRALREWARKHPEYALEEEQNENPKKKILKNFKSWLRYHGYDSNYENGTGDYDEEIAIDEDIICAIWDVKRLSESLNDMNYRLLKAGYKSIKLKETVMKLYSKYIEETKGSEDE